MVKLLAIAVVILIIAAPLAGCAESRSVPAGNNVPAGDEAAIRDTLDAFFDALRARDYDKAISYVGGY